MTMTHRKVCPKCVKNKSLDEFKPRPDGRPSGYCYECSITYYREYNEKRYTSPEAREEEVLRTRKRYLEVFKPARKERKLRLVRLMGGCCVICGYNRSAAALDFDHIDPSTKLRTVSHLLAANQPWAWEAALEEAKKCRLICSNCHREITYPGHELASQDEFPAQPPYFLSTDDIGEIPTTLLDPAYSDLSLNYPAEPIMKAVF